MADYGWKEHSKRPRLQARYYLIFLLCFKYNTLHVRCALEVDKETRRVQHRPGYLGTDMVLNCDYALSRELLCLIPVILYTICTCVLFSIILV